MSAGVASSPSSRLTGSPGAMCISRKIRKEMPSSTGIAPMSLRLKVFMGVEYQRSAIRLQRCERRAASSLAQPAEGPVQDLQRPIDLILVDVERRRDAEHVAVGAALAHEQAVSPGQLHHPLGVFHVGLLSFADQLHAL